MYAKQRVVDGDKFMARARSVMPKLVSYGKIDQWFEEGGTEK